MCRYELHRYNCIIAIGVSRPGFDASNINVEKRAEEHQEFVNRCVLSKNLRVLFIPNADKLPTKELVKKFLNEIVIYKNDRDCNPLVWAKPAGSFRGTSNFRMFLHPIASDGTTAHKRASCERSRLLASVLWLFGLFCSPTQYNRHYQYNQYLFPINICKLRGQWIISLKRRALTSPHARFLEYPLPKRAGPFLRTMADGIKARPEEVDINLNDPQVGEAAKKIQNVFRISKKMDTNEDGFFSSCDSYLPSGAVTQTCNRAEQKAGSKKLDKKPNAGAEVMNGSTGASG
ncbi:hypothetical protein TELCIR_06105 [Teladorsagia circumcincta]|uniref:Uncharacterized protein n=1 Tax=Teladorsagia circumcincta TaxID=45464 RepID=A0A2G9UP19_TELCI|nr:hypothetical protein TELCIR_06105 [Teladorsagia circumcincta]